jgi:hypothetical protein
MIVVLIVASSTSASNMSDKKNPKTVSGLGGSDYAEEERDDDDDTYYSSSSSSSSSRVKRKGRYFDRETGLPDNYHYEQEAIHINVDYGNNEGSDDEYYYDGYADYDKYYEQYNNDEEL